MANDIQGITVDIDGNTVKFQRGMADVNEELRNSTKELKNSSKVLRIYGKDTETLTKHQKVIAKQIALTEVKLEAYTKELEDLGDINEITSDKERKRFKQLERLIDDSATELKILGKQAEDTNKDLQKLKDVDVTIDAENDASKKIQDAEGDLKSIDGRKAEARITADASELTKAIDDAKSELDSFAGAAFGLVGGAELAEGLETGVESALAKGFAKGKTEANLADYTDQTRDQILDYLQGELGFSEKVSEMIISQASAYSDNTDELIKYSRTLANASTLGAIKEGEPLNAGETFKTYSDQVRDAIEAGSITALEDLELNTQRMLSQIVNSGKLTEEQLSKVNDEITEMDRLETAFKELTDTQRLEVLNSEIQNTYNNSVDGLDAGTLALWNAAGAMTTISDRISGAFEKIAILLAPIVIAIGKFAESNPQIFELVIIVGALAAALATFLTVIGGVVALIPVMAGGFAAVSGAIGAVVSAIGAIAAAIGWPIAAIVALIALLWTFRDEVLAVLKIVFDALSKFGVWLWEKCGQLFDYLGQKASEFFTSFISWVTNLPANIATGLNNLVQSFKNAFNNIKNAIIDSIGSAIDWALSKIQGLIGVITGIPGRITSSVSSAVDKINPFSRSAQTTNTTNNNSDTQIFVSNGTTERKASLFERMKIQKGLPA